MYATWCYVLRSSCPQKSKDALIWFYKTKNRQRDKSFCISVIILKLSPQQSRLTIRKEGIRNTCLKLNRKTYIFLSSKIFSNSIWSLINFMFFLHHNCLISQQNWLYIKRKSLYLSSTMTKKQCKPNMLDSLYYVRNVI